MGETRIFTKANTGTIAGFYPDKECTRERLNTMANASLLPITLYLSGSLSPPSALHRGKFILTLLESRKSNLTLVECGEPSLAPADD